MDAPDRLLDLVIGIGWAMRVSQHAARYDARN
jgi:hypothetical protein